MSRPVRVAALVIAALLVAFGCGAEGPAKVEVVPGAPAGDVRAVRGEVTATRDGAARPLAVGDVVSGDDLIATGADGDVTIELRHNGAVWTLGGGQSRKVADAAAWNAPKKTGGGASGERSTAAGRHAEREGADTAASVVAPGAGAKAEATGAPAMATNADPAPPAADEPEAVMRKADEPKPDPQPTERRAPRSPVSDEPSDKKPEKTTIGGGGSGCDEVTCLLDGSAACCAKYKGKRARDPDPKPYSDIPESLNQGDIKAGLDRIRARALGCADDKGVTGVVKVKVKVAPDGTVSNVEVVETPDAEVGQCVARVVKTATFQATQNGGSFTYPFKL